MLDPPPDRHLQRFLESADFLSSLFLFLDEKATRAAIIRTKNAEIEPSYFGETVLKFANLDFITSEGALAPRITQEFDPTAQEALKHFATHLFLNLAWWYVGPILWAVHFHCPYMPESWVKKFLEQKTSLPLPKQIEYLDSIVAFIRSQEASIYITQAQELRWITPYDDISGQLGQKGRYILRMLIGMLLDALENSKDPQKPPDGKSTKGLDPSIIKFIETLDIDDFGRKNKPR